VHLYVSYVSQNKHQCSPIAYSVNQCLCNCDAVCFLRGINWNYKYYLEENG
jgi:hypothetical protein